MAISFVQLLPSVIIGILFAIPLWLVLPRTGLPAWLSLLSLIPLVGVLAVLVLLWVVAFRRWPSDNVAEIF